ncbi:MAG: hypothetical protein ACTSRP_00180 [Candidatus Helarchaeota archaeon]
MKIVNFNINKVQDSINTVIEETDIIGCILCSEEGLLIIDTFGYDSIYNPEIIAAMAASMINDHNYGIIPPDEIVLHYSHQNEKVIIRKVQCKRKLQEFLLITIVPLKMRYYRRYVNKLIKIVIKNL